MIQYKSITNEQYLQQIVDTLLLNGTLVHCAGLVHGKTGIAVFFFHYANYTKKELFADYALDLIGEIQTQIHAHSPANYETGIAGIGVGIDYLIRNNYLNVDKDFFDDFNQRMVRAVMYEPFHDFSLYDGLTGYGRYWISRFRDQISSVSARSCLTYIVEMIKEKWSIIPLNEQIDIYCFLSDLRELPGFDGCASIMTQGHEWDFTALNKNLSFSRLGSSALDKIIRICHYDRYLVGDPIESVQYEIDNVLRNRADSDFNKTHNSMGLLTGYAGEGLLHLTTLNQIDLSWAMLL